MSKRPAAASLEEPEAKKRKPLRRKIKSPQIGSLYDILHDHAGLSLHMLPICWTDLHAQLLGCRFVQLPAQTWPTPSPASSDHTIRPSRTPEAVVNISRNLDRLVDDAASVYTKNESIKSILKTLFPGRFYQTSSEIPMRCADRCYTKAVRCQVVWNAMLNWHSFEPATTCAASRPTSQSTTSKYDKPTTPTLDAPLLAYINRGNLGFYRRNCFRVAPCPDGSTNVPIYRLQRIRSKKLFPKNPDEDHYFLAAMIAMAQQHVYMKRRDQAVQFTPKDVQVRLLTISEDDNCFIVYTGTIPEGLLTMFHEPDKAPRANTRIMSVYCRVPFWPVLGLKERLGQALGKDLVGDFDEDSIDHFDEEADSVSDNVNPEWAPFFGGLGREASKPAMSKLPSPKRSREILSEVFNASFCEDRESEYPSDVLGFAAVGNKRITELWTGMKEQALPLPEEDGDDNDDDDEDDDDDDDPLCFL
ncbi:hypothetical protein AAE478_005285 [Parahypoxylon ruwenzoriense]